VTTSRIHGNSFCPPLAFMNPCLIKEE
jgi:hypothetical protein